MSRPASEIRPFFAAYSNTTTSAYFAVENSTLLSLFAELYLQMSLTILFRAYYFLTYPNRLLNSERPREERNFQSISKNGAKREDPFGYGRVKWQESAISGMRLVLDIREGGTHSGCLDSKIFFSTIDAPPRVPGASKNHILFFTNESVFLLR